MFWALIPCSFDVPPPPFFNDFRYEYDNFHPKRRERTGCASLMDEE